MLARTLLDRYYPDFQTLLMEIADTLATQVVNLPCDTLQVDEANIPGNPEDAGIAAQAINRVLGAFKGRRAVHLCFGNYGGQTVQQGTWRALTAFLNALHVDHVVLEMAHRNEDDLIAMKEVDPRIRIGLGVKLTLRSITLKHRKKSRRALNIRRANPGSRCSESGWIHP